MNRIIQQVSCQTVGPKGDVVAPISFELKGYRKAGPVLLAPGHNNWLYLVCFAQNVEDDLYNLTCWNIASGELAWASDEVVAGEDVYALSWLVRPGGQVVIGAATEAGGPSWDMGSGGFLGLCEDAGVMRAITSCRLPSGRSIFVGGGRGRVHCWDPSTGEPLNSWPVLDAYSVAAGRLADGRVLIAVGEVGGKIYRWDAVTGEHFGDPLRSQGEEGAWRLNLLDLPDGRSMLTGFDYDGTITRWDAASGAPMGDPIVLEDELLYVNVGGAVIDGVPCLIATTEDDIFHCWHAVTGKPISVTWHGDCFSIVRHERSQGDSTIAIVHSYDATPLTISKMRFIGGNLSLGY
jgi:WD40 repeat protein